MLQSYGLIHAVAMMYLAKQTGYNTACTSDLHINRQCSSPHDRWNRHVWQLPLLFMTRELQTWLRRGGKLLSASSSKQAMSQSGPWGTLGLLLPSHRPLSPERHQSLPTLGKTGHPEIDGWGRGLRWAKDGSLRSDPKVECLEKDPVTDWLPVKPACYTKAPRLTDSRKPLQAPGSDLLIAA